MARSASRSGSCSCSTPVLPRRPRRSDITGLSPFPRTRPASAAERGEMRQHGVRAFDADDGGQLLAVGAAHARDAAKRGEQCLAPARTDAGNAIELGLQIALRARLAMEGDGEAVRFV